MMLLVDAGNGGVKWGTLKRTRITTGETIAHGGGFAATVGAAWSALEPPERVVVSNVAGAAFAEALSAWTREVWGVEAEFITAAAKRCGVVNAYREPEKLGADRWAALVAARAAVEGAVCVVDCGTAITLDALCADGRHLGGLILPGVALMRRSLLEGTEGIRDLAGGEAGLLARDTAGAVNGGTLYTAVAVIDRVTADVAAELGVEMTRIITGGGAAELLPLLAGEYRHEPELVLRGVAAIAKEAERK